MNTLRTHRKYISFYRDIGWIERMSEKVYSVSHGIATGAEFAAAGADFPLGATHHGKFEHGGSYVHNFDLDKSIQYGWKTTLHTFTNAEGQR